MVLIKLFYILQLISILTRYTKEVNLKIINSTPINIIYILLLILYFIMKRKKIIQNNSVFIATISLICLFSIYSIVFINKEFSHDIYVNSIKSFVFILNIYLTSIFIVRNNQKEFFLKSAYLVISIFLISHYICNFDKFQGILSITKVFNNELRYRESYGLTHPNSTGLICFIALVTSSLLKNINKTKLFKVYIILGNIIILIILISTASRNAITCTILFYLGCLVLKNLRNIINVSKSRYFKMSVYICVITICVIMIVTLLVKVDFNYIINKSNRLLNFVINIPFLKSIHKDIFGLGFVNGDMLMPETSIYNITYVDNYYIYIYMMFGVVGVLLMLIYMMYLCKVIFFNKHYLLLEKINVSMLFITHIYCSIFERCFFEPFSLITYIFFIIYFIFLLEGDNFNEQNQYNSSNL